MGVPLAPLDCIACSAFVVSLALDVEIVCGWGRVCSISRSGCLVRGETLHGRMLPVAAGGGAVAAVSKYLTSLAGLGAVPSGPAPAFEATLSADGRGRTVRACGRLCSYFSSLCRG
jgi:hypothetical protein